jgi:uncharacterized membrane protein
MLTLATAQTTSTAPAAAFFARWADTDTWPEWNTDTEWVTLRGPFEQGARGQLKPKGAPRVGFEVTALVPGEEFTDVSRLVGARLTFRHLLSTTPEGATRVDVTVTMRGPLARVWAKALGKGIAQSLQGDLDRLAAAAEASAS